jgi:hypothetical protein
MTTPSPLACLCVWQPSYLSSAVSMFSYFGSAAPVVEKEDADKVPEIADEGAKSLTVLTQQAELEMQMLKVANEKKYKVRNSPDK